MIKKEVLLVFLLVPQVVERERTDGGEVFKCQIEPRGFDTAALAKAARNNLIVTRRAATEQRPCLSVA